MDEVGDIVRGEIDSSEGARERTKGERTAGGVMRAPKLSVLWTPMTSGIAIPSCLR